MWWELSSLSAAQDKLEAQHFIILRSPITPVLLNTKTLWELLKVPEWQVVKLVKEERDQKADWNQLRI